MAKPTAAERASNMGNAGDGQQAVPARMSIHCPNATPVIEELGGGQVLLNFRMDQPWIKVTIPMTTEQAQVLGKALSAPRVITADTLPAVN